jgi:hypothetical protein
MCFDARSIAEDAEFVQEFSSLVLSIVASSSLAEFEAEFASQLKEYCKPVRTVMLGRIDGRNVDLNETRCIIAHSLYRYMNRQAFRSRWQYEDTNKIVSSLSRALLSPEFLAIMTDPQTQQHLRDESKQSINEFCRQYEDSEQPLTAVHHVA